MYKAKIDQLSKEKTDVLPHDPNVVMWNERDFESPVFGLTSASVMGNSDAQHLEDKFLLLKEKLKVKFCFLNSNVLSEYQFFETSSPYLFGYIFH